MMTAHDVLPIEAPTNALYRRIVSTDLRCMLCDRVPARVHRVKEHINGREEQRTTVQVIDPAHTDAVRRLRCPDCSGRLLLHSEEDRLDIRRPLTLEERLPTRGRPRRAAAP